MSTPDLRIVANPEASTRRCAYPGCTEQVRNGVWPETHCSATCRALDRIEADEREVLRAMYAAVSPPKGREP